LPFFHFLSGFRLLAASVFELRNQTADFSVRQELQVCSLLSKRTRSGRPATSEAGEFALAATHSKIVTHDVVSRRLIAEIVHRVRPVNSRRVEAKASAPKTSFLGVPLTAVSLYTGSVFGAPTALDSTPVTVPSF
jgi:hypothetical protein